MEYLKKLFTKVQERNKRNMILDAISREFCEDYSNHGYSTEHLEEILKILRDEREFMVKHGSTKFESFSYFRPGFDELPAFYYTHTSDYGTRFVQRVFPFTPKMFKRCMRSLDKKERLIFSQDFETFKEMYWKIANAAKYQEESWTGALFDIKNSLIKEWKKFEKESEGRITIDDLKRVNWSEFGGEIKPYLAPSYNKNPAEVDIYLSKSGKPVVKLKMQSTTTPSYRRVCIQGTEVSASINSDCGFVYNQEMTDVWKNYYTELLLEHVNDPETEQIGEKQ